MRFLALVCAIAVSTATPALCQRKAAERPPAPPANSRPQKFNHAPPNPVEQLKEFQKLTPEQRAQEIAKLPPKRRETLEKQLANFDAMTPVERERAFHRLELMQTLTPDRRQAVNEAIKSLRARYKDLPPRERRQGLAKELYSDDMPKRWSPIELELIHGAFPNI